MYDGTMRLAFASALLLQSAKLQFALQFRRSNGRTPAQIRRAWRAAIDLLLPDT